MKINLIKYGEGLNTQETCQRIFTEIDCHTNGIVELDFNGVKYLGNEFIISYIIHKNRCMNYGVHIKEINISDIFLSQIISCRDCVHYNRMNGKHYCFNHAFMSPNVKNLKLKCLKVGIENNYPFMIIPEVENEKIKDV